MTDDVCNSSFLAGVLPLSFSLSQRQLRFMSLLGTGVLVGTSLIVIIPEGIETMYSAGKATAHTNALSPSAQQPNIPVGSNPQKPGAVGQKSEYANPGRSSGEDTSFLRSGASKGPNMNIVVEKTPETGHRRVRRSLDDTPKQKQKQKDTQKEKESDKDAPAPQRGGDDDSTEGHEEGHTRVHAPEDEKEEIIETGEGGPEPHAYIGVSLILGFIMMFLVDHLPEALSPTKPKYQPLHISLSDLSRGPHNSSSVSLNALGGLNTPVSPMPERQRAPPRKSSATTVGLIIHAFADGIALGASSTAPSTSLSLIIFFAIMLHKAPAAFGLTAVLLKNGLSKRTARTHLMFFSLAAPAGAAFTWAVVHTLGRARLGGDDSLTWMTGWVLLFSGGTFL
jgi:zinc transporter 9